MRWKKIVKARYQGNLFRYYDQLVRMIFIEKKKIFFFRLYIQINVNTYVVCVTLLERTDWQKIGSKLERHRVFLFVLNPELPLPRFLSENRNFRLVICDSHCQVYIQNVRPSLLILLLLQIQFFFLSPVSYKRVSYDNPSY